MKTVINFVLIFQLSVTYTTFLPESLFSEVVVCLQTKFRTQERGDKHLFSNQTFLVRLVFNTTKAGLGPNRKWTRLTATVNKLTLFKV